MWWLKFGNLLPWAPTSPSSETLFDGEFPSPVDKRFPALRVRVFWGQPIASPGSVGWGYLLSMDQ